MSADAVSHEARAFTRSKTFEALARAGYAARGVIYAVIGLLALRLAEGIGGPRPSQQGAMHKIAGEHYGHTLLLLTAAGLGGYAVWRLMQALVGETPEYGRHSALDRLGALGSSIAYAAFCVLAIEVLDGTDGRSPKPQATTAGVLRWPAGRELVAAPGVLFLGIAAYQAYLGLSRKFLTYSKTGQMSRGFLRAFTAIGEIGLVARAIAFGLIGIFILKAARDYSPKDAVGLDGALARIPQHAYGSAALIVVACGLMVFGAYSIADARFRKI